ncbi:hypothetical protein TBLA_0I01350 [Henningerozyma blattae CBS 6284]|uniref:B30.2/SPRY domain-containing protein n=1 Tax=Henningerozyma blattae (strain ATCC 34711 / CBS 6284 / DSM 70876 / NBRC 10599 / NRRL Y-10934 / UCD 77-7) TaxID=1071380 RepID=I2H8U3_HENB6|nr:hypothetical protein TBLA_0I01350 [Tetrapisispora blattae CBS 6284]CCH62795.1 hypothetical protein TBLA_0I01350 [Tetrapisispora blattae CBS 6284]
MLLPETFLKELDPNHTANVKRDVTINDYFIANDANSDDPTFTLDLSSLQALLDNMQTKHESEATEGTTNIYIKQNNETTHSYIFPPSFVLLAIFGFLVIVFISSYFKSIEEEEYEQDDDYDYDDDEEEEDAELMRNTRANKYLRLIKMQRKYCPNEDGFLLNGDFNHPSILRMTDPKLRDKRFKKLSVFEKQLYNHCTEFQSKFGPSLKEFGSTLSYADLIKIRDRGLESYFFLPSVNDNIDEMGNFNPSFLINDKLNVSFTKYNRSSSTILNYPVPFNNKKVVYFEVKIYKFPKDSNTIFSIGLMTSPYPYFMIPGRANYSIGYESTGKLFRNNPLGDSSKILPELQEGDTVGFGFKYSTGTIFITHNGNKVLDVAENINLDLYIGIGAINTTLFSSVTSNQFSVSKEKKIELDNESSSSESLIDRIPISKNKKNPSFISSSDVVQLHLNIGQRGYVYPKANAKKYSFGSKHGEIGAPPNYDDALTGHDRLINVCGSNSNYSTLPSTDAIRNIPLPPRYSMENFELNTLSCIDHDEIENDNDTTTIVGQDYEDTHNNDSVSNDVYIGCSSTQPSIDNDIDEVNENIINDCSSQETCIDDTRNEEQDYHKLRHGSNLSDEYLLNQSSVESVNINGLDGPIEERSLLDLPSDTLLPQLINEEIETETKKKKIKKSKK